MKTLDLHGVKHVDVMRMVDNFLWESMNTNLKEVEIITGMSEQMKRIIYEICEEYKMLCQEDFLNKGKLIIKIII
jgi:hypothetical protein